MIVEKRVWNISQVHNMRITDGIVVGDEGCIYKVLANEVQELFAYAEEKKIPVRYLTPFVPDKFVDILYERICKFADRVELKVVFNDYGLLHRCKNLIAEGKIIPVLGRILTRSIIDCTWADKLLQNEEPELAKQVLGYSFLHDHKLELLQEYNIKEMEINIPAIEPIRNLDLKDVKIIIHKQESIVSVGRVCFAARYASVEIPDCLRTDICNNKIKFSLLKKWKRNTSTLLEAEEEYKKYYEDMYLKGNIVYREINEEEFQKMLNQVAGYVD